MTAVTEISVTLRCADCDTTIGYADDQDGYGAVYSEDTLYERCCESDEAYYSDDTEQYYCGDCIDAQDDEQDDEYDEDGLDQNIEEAQIFQQF